MFSRPWCVRVCVCECVCLLEAGTGGEEECVNAKGREEVRRQAVRTHLCVYVCVCICMCVWSWWSWSYRGSIAPHLGFLRLELGLLEATLDHPPPDQALAPDLKGQIDLRTG